LRINSRFLSDATGDGTPVNVPFFPLSFTFLTWSINSNAEVHIGKAELANLLHIAARRSHVRSGKKNAMLEQSLLPAG